MAIDLRRGPHSEPVRVIMTRVYRGRLRNNALAVVGCDWTAITNCRKKIPIFDTNCQTPGTPICRCCVMYAGSPILQGRTKKKQGSKKGRKVPFDAYRRKSRI